jgi:hypothetical protein
MPNKKKGKGIKKKDNEDLSTIIIPQQVSTEITVSIDPIPFKSKNKKIHNRQNMPLLKKGAIVPDEKPTGLTKPEE